MNASGSAIIVALDFASADEAMAFTGRLSPEQCRLKVGKELFTWAGPALVEKLVARGFDVFLDLKFHDIPNTVARACEAAADLGVWMINVHASGGRRMMSAAVEALHRRSGPRPYLIGVTVLTSLNEADLAEIGFSGSPADNVARLAALAQSAGLDGVVCSPLEVARLREVCGDGFLLVTPGVRPAGTAADDQQRIMTPSQAIAHSSDYLVIGRPVTQAEDPIAALAAIRDEIGQLHPD